MIPNHLTRCNKVMRLIQNTASHGRQTFFIHIRQQQQFLNIGRNQFQGTPADFNHTLFASLAAVCRATADKAVHFNRQVNRRFVFTFYGALASLADVAVSESDGEDNFFLSSNEK